MFCKPRLFLHVHALLGKQPLLASWLFFLSSRAWERAHAKHEHHSGFFCFCIWHSRVQLSPLKSRGCYPWQRGLPAPGLGNHTANNHVTALLATWDQVFKEQVNRSPLWGALPLQRSRHPPDRGVPTHPLSFVSLFYVKPSQKGIMFLLNNGCA